MVTTPNTQLARRASVFAARHFAVGKADRVSARLRSAMAAGFDAFTAWWTYVVLPVTSPTSKWTPAVTISITSVRKHRSGNHGWPLGGSS